MSDLSKRVKENGSMIALLLAVVLFSATLGFLSEALVPNGTNVVQPGTQNAGVAYIVFADSIPAYFARNGKTGAIDYSSATFTALMNSTVAAVTASGGGVVQLADGSYTANYRVLVPSKVSIRGSSQSGTIITLGAAVGITGLWEVYNNINNVTLSYMTINGNKGSYPSNGAVYIRIAKDVSVNHITFTNFGNQNAVINVYQAGAESPALSRISVTDNTFLNDDYGPIFAIPQSTLPAEEIVFSRNLIINGAGADPSGVLPFSNINNLIVSENTFLGVNAVTVNTGLILVENSNDVVISNNIIDGHTATTLVVGIRVGPGVVGASISNNVLRDASNGLYQAAIMVWSPPPETGICNRGISVTGNTIFWTSNPPNQVNGIVVQDCNYGVTVSGNVIDGGSYANVNAGIYLHGSSATHIDIFNAVITGNSVTNTSVGINLTWTNSTIATGNTVHASTYGVLFASSRFSLVAWNTFRVPSTPAITDTTSGAYNIVEWNDLRLCVAPAISMTGVSPTVANNFLP